MKAYYSLIQFCPDPSRLETVNVGVLLFCPEAGFVRTKLSQNNARAVKLVGRKNLDKHSLDAAKRAMRNRVIHTSETFRNVEDLQRFVDSQGNVLRLTPPRFIKVEAPNDDLDRLFEELVGDRRDVAEEAESNDAIVAKVDATFQRLYKEGRASLNVPVTVPILQNQIKIPYAFKNGIVSFVATPHFSQKEGVALRTAAELAVEGDLIQRHYRDTKLIVVGAFGEGASDRAIEVRVQQVLAEYNVKGVLPSEVPEFLDSVDRQAHEAPVVEDSRPSRRAPQQRLRFD